ncbi:hypothetical protein Fmac_013502 [Flemingia macrophylla]|uniref:Uncharacterized protein n=1 Tax=Flemingia macrophylla TaxID=520843 RepID=A0ABD1MTA9_9FABA
MVSSWATPISQPSILYYHLATLFRGVIPHQQLQLLPTKSNQIFPQAPFTQLPKAPFSFLLLLKPPQLSTLKYAISSKRNSIYFPASPKRTSKRVSRIDEQIIDLRFGILVFSYDGRFPSNFKLLLGVGITHSNVDILLKRWPNILCSTNLLKTFQELKQMGFDISTSTFCIAFLAKRAVNKTKWEEEEIDTFKRWFRVERSGGFDFMILVKALEIFLLSLLKRIALRALVVKFLTSKDTPSLCYWNEKTQTSLFSMILWRNPMLPMLKLGQGQGFFQSDHWTSE